ncbi:GNAT family N-acetyltransferase [Methanobrevibacter filiformis]|uniref:Putative ribosomal N-acetyltransferase YdaF n=1 Tax=Methanobrevibacter filiformis TaxID=55758 RepID=A0A166EV56_9EURY|nr:GNAT family protein [Methanobrevibacter filiformis]KZX17048.1 putative ribosomal N-acetyltransferase YdaF [Methanobrevibacter filiformis]
MHYLNKLDGNRIFLSLSRKEDLYLYNDWLNDHEINLTFGRSHIVFNEEKQAEYIEDYNNSNDKFFLVIVKKGNANEDEQAIGIGLLYDVDFVHGKGTLGLLLDKSFQSKGYGKESTNLLLEFAFNILNLNNVMLYAIDFNEKAIAMYESFGFKTIGHRREAYPINNKVYDEVYMDILKKEFNLRQGFFKEYDVY